MYVHTYMCVYIIIIIIFPQNIQSVTATMSTTSSHFNEPGIPEVETTEKNKAISQQRKQKNEHALFSITGGKSSPGQTMKSHSQEATPSSSSFSSFQSCHFVGIMLIPTQRGMLLFPLGLVNVQSAKVRTGQSLNEPGNSMI